MGKLGRETEIEAGTRLGGGRFVVLETVGLGGMGQVCRASDSRFQSDVALKLLRADDAWSDDALDAMRHESRKCIELSHPNIVRVHDLHLARGEPPFIAMEFIEGESLAAMARSQPAGCFEWAELAPLLGQLCGALAYAHGEQIIHRDIKPANIMVDRSGRVKLTDFGIAGSCRRSVDKTTRDLGSSGTPACMSPQQLRGELPVPADDVYALGATIYELLTGGPLFHSGDVRWQILEEKPPPVGERRAELGIPGRVPRRVGKTLARCLEKSAAARPGSIAELATALGLELDSLPEPTVDPGRREPRLQSATVVGGAVLAVVAMVAGALLWDRPFGEGRLVPEPRPDGHGIVQLVAGELMHASVVEVLRDESTSDPGILRELSVGRWTPKSRAWSLDDGVLRITLASPARMQEVEHDLVFPDSLATNFEFGVAFDADRAFRPSRLRQVFFSRVQTNRMADVALRVGEKYLAFYPYGASSPAGAARPHVGAEERPKDSFPLSEVDLSGPEFAGCREMIARLKQSRLVKEGGSWLVLQVVGPHVRVFLDGKTMEYTHLGEAAYDPEFREPSVGRVRRLSKRPGMVGLSVALNDDQRGFTARYSGFYFRNLDQVEWSKPAVSALPAGSRLEAVPSPGDYRTPPLSTRARELGIRQLLSPAVSPRFPRGRPPTRSPATFIPTWREIPPVSPTWNCGIGNRAPSGAGRTAFWHCPPNLRPWISPKNGRS